MAEWLLPDEDEVLADARRHGRKGIAWWCEWYGLPASVLKTRLEAMVSARKLAARKDGAARLYGPARTMDDIVCQVRRSMNARAREGVVVVSAKTLGVELGVSPQDAWLALKRLEEKGEITRIEMSRRPGGSVWRVAGQAKPAPAPVLEAEGRAGL